MNIEDKIKEAMAAVFECDIAEINEDSSPDTIENWDSIRAMNLVVALEEIFNVEFDDDEIADMLNYKLIYHTLKEKV